MRSIIIFTTVKWFLKRVQSDRPEPDWNACSSVALHGLHKVNKLAVQFISVQLSSFRSLFTL